MAALLAILAMNLTVYVEPHCVTVTWDTGGYALCNDNEWKAGR